MRIGFLGNANNYPLILAKALKRLGQEVVFILMFDKTWPLDRPENRYNDLGPPYPEWIFDASPLDLWNYEADLPQLEHVLTLLRSCDGVILNQYALCLAPLINRPTIALLTGTDLLTLATYDYVDQMVNWPGRTQVEEAELFYLKQVLAQRLGIRSAIGVIFVPFGTIPQGDAILAGLGVEDSRRLAFKMVDVAEIMPVPPPFNNPVRIFCATRLTWDKSRPPFYTEIDYKGSDIMVRGLARFAKIRPHLPLDIHLVKKGAHVAETMALVEAEGLGPYITWHEEMTQREVWEQFKLSDIIFEQLDTSDIGMAGLEAMAMGRPVIGHERFTASSKIGNQASAICEASTPEEVCAQLQRLVSDPEERRRVGEASRRYVENYFSADLAARKVMDRFRSSSADGMEFPEKRNYSILKNTYKQLELDYSIELQRRCSELEKRLQLFDNFIKIFPAFLRKIIVKFI